MNENNGNGNGRRLFGHFPVIWLVGILFAAGGLYMSFRLAQSDLGIVKLSNIDHEKRLTVVETEMRGMRDDQTEMKRDIKELLRRVR